MVCTRLRAAEQPGNTVTVGAAIAVILILTINKNINALPHGILE